MASVTLEVKINNQSCKQRKRRGRSWGKRVTKEKHIGTSKVKQKRITESRLKSSCKQQIIDCLVGQFIGKEPRVIFLPSPSWQGQLGICFEASTMGLFGHSPHIHIIYSTFAFSCENGWAEAGWGRGRTCKSTGASLAIKAGVFALRGCAAKGQMSPALPHRSGLGAAKLTGLPRFKLRSFNQEMLQERSVSIWWAWVSSPAVFHWYQRGAPHHQNCSRKKQLCSSMLLFLILWSQQLKASQREWW